MVYLRILGAAFYFQLFEDFLRILKFGKQDHGCDHIRFEACFFVKAELCNGQTRLRQPSPVLTAYAGDIGRQAVEIQSLSVLCSLHQFLRCTPSLCAVRSEPEVLFSSLSIPSKSPAP